ncbi:hypothetical protein BHE90_012426 [Fusarium euwallaceae]|uniref:Uncharacterized protein n=1 Tax=Fusarium euwallaceae TaxID=1147111 RepID=A0A430LBN9_9HYPO|nr:hypothetical protein BHE90_012426 [Fusarium euwallaceae]
MDGLQEQAKDLFQNQKFAAPTARYSLVEIFQYQASTESHHKSVLARDLLDSVNCAASQLRSATARLYLVKIDRNNAGQLQIAKQLFLDLLHACRLEGYVQYLIEHESYGLQHFTSTMTSGNLRNPDIFYINTVSGMLLWSYDSSSVATRAIFMPRNSNSVFDNVNIFNAFLSTLDHQKDFINYPWLLQFVCVIELCRWLDLVHGFELQRIRLVEEQTRHGSWISESQEKLDLQQLTEVSQSVGFSVSALANAVRHVHIALELLNINISSPPPSATSSQSKAELVREATRLLSRQVHYRKLDLEYLQERSKNQVSIIFSLISQKSTATSLEIASSSKNDSSSMKVLAFMTMFFLPGTFFATLFAVPSLHWTEDRIISDRF